MGAAFNFGTPLSRLFRGGVVLAPAEQWLLAQLIFGLAPPHRSTAEAQLQACNLAQREIDGRAIFYGVKASTLDHLPSLPVQSGSLIRLSAAVPGGELVHATLNAISGRIFCMNMSMPVQGLGVEGLQTVRLRQSWVGAPAAHAPG